MDRRQFIKRSSQAAVGLAFVGRPRWLFASPASPAATSKILDFSVPSSPSLPQIAVARGGPPGKMVTDAVAALGGVERFIRKGDRVVVKPNASWDSSPELGADTHPDVVAALVTLCLKAGARQVVVLDHTIDEPRRCFARSGIGPAASAAGGRVEFQGTRNFRDVTLGEGIGTWPVMTALFEADKFINLPVVKSHSLSTLTAAMKNLYGIAGGTRSRLHRKIDESIVALANFVRPTLVILDAVRVMIRNGPSGGGAADLIHPHVIAAGTDQVALDAFAATLLGARPEDVGHIRLAHKKGLGEMDYKKLRIKHINSV